MNRSVKRVLERIALASAAFITLGGSGFALPPGPPDVPVGGIGSAVATSILVVGYGIWKSRR